MLECMRADEAPPRFTSPVAWEVFAEACTLLGLPGEDTELLRLGENAIFRLAGKPLVLRIGRSLARLPLMELELCVARWLDNAGVPVARPYDGVTQPTVVGNHPVSVWHLVAQGTPRPGVADLAVLLRQVHALHECPCPVPQWDPLTQAERRLLASAELDNGDQAMMLDRCHELRDRLGKVKFALPTGFMHGDAYPGNLLGQAGNAVLTDFEAAATGPREWDLIGTAVTRTRFGLPAEAYQEFCDLYGFNVMTWDGYPVLRDIRELYMTSWLIQNLADRQAVADEAALRIASIRDRDTTREWHVF